MWSGKTYGSRSESSSRAKKHKGNPKPPEGGLGFPSAWEEEKKKREHGVDETNQTKEKKRDAYKNQTRVGVLKGSKYQGTPDPWENKLNIKNRQLPEDPKKTTCHKP